MLLSAVHTQLTGFLEQAQVLHEQFIAHDLDVTGQAVEVETVGHQLLARHSRRHPGPIELSAPRSLRLDRPRSGAIRRRSARTCRLVYPRVEFSVLSAFAKPIDPRIATCARLCRRSAASSPPACDPREPSLQFESHLRRRPTRQLLRR
jgi:hypothetical protein